MEASLRACALQTVNINPLPLPLSDLLIPFVCWNMRTNSRKEGIRGRKTTFFFSFFWREGGPETLSAHINLTLSSAGLREARTIHTPAWQHSWRLKRSGVTQWPHPANQFQGTNSGPLFLLYVFALVEQTLSLMLQCALCSLIDWIGTEHFYVC